MSRSVYLALGDSVTAGHGVTHPSLTFVNQVSTFTRQRGLTDRTIVIARNGWTTKDIYQATSAMSEMIWKETNVITLMAGGNDLRRLLRRQYLSLSGAPISRSLVNRRLYEFRFQIQRLFALIATKRIPHVVIATVYNPVPNYALAEEAIDALNGITREAAQSHKFTVVDVNEGFRNHEVYFIDGYRTGRFEDLASPIRRPIHPNNSGHKAIADLVTSQLAAILPNANRRPKGKRTDRTRRRRIGNAALRL